MKLFLTLFFFDIFKVDQIRDKERSKISETSPGFLQTSKMKSFATMVIIIANLSIVAICGDIGFVSGYYPSQYLPAQVNNGNTRRRCEIC